ncbi:MAG: class I tRNA ligase family protein [Candidatus Paceibacterota bacterium]|jgi:isoleucyl-tRNA synthetase
MAENSEKKKSEVALREERILEFWKENKTFEKSLEQTEGKKEFVFFEGPPTANGKPGIHHLEARAFKDAIPRYKTMQGFHVRRKGGWDTHGLPVELQVEKKLGLNSKKAIEEYGVAKFNQECKESVWEYLDIWNKFTYRIGYWVDQENPYVTYRNDYIESVWNIVKEINKQKLLYKDYKVVPWCPRCGTALSSHELAQGYEDVKDLSVYVKFKIKNQENTYIIAWTTTPWTLPGNVALAVGEDVDYRLIIKGNEKYIVAEKRITNLFELDGTATLDKTLKGKDLIGLEYEPLYPYLADIISESEKPKLEKAFKVYGADFVTTLDGTGVVHTAVMYGQDDFELGTKIGLPKQHLVGLDGKFLQGTGMFEGRFVRDENVAVDVIKDLAHRSLLFKKEKYEHSYPHCWRCKTALIYYARDSWYIKVSDPKIKDKMIAENKEINWEPAHIRDGRFGEWLREIKDWAISRERYWGTPLPVWSCESCQKIEVIGSIEDLKNKTKKSGNKYFVMRHGEAENNALCLYSSNQKINHLTKDGEAEVEKTAEVLLSKKITKIYCSPFLRTRETAEIVAKQTNFPKDQIIYDDRIRELEFGDFSDRPEKDFWDYTKNKNWEFDTAVPGGESYQDAKNRMGDFLYEVDQKNKNENILIISHGLAIEMVPAIIEGADKKRSLEIFHSHICDKPASLHREHEFISLPHNVYYELDLHKPFIDEVDLVCGCGGNLRRTREVMDVWFDSGCMPFAQDHYPFENKKLVEGVGYPADFISEAIDQTRGWFYTLHAVGILMGRGKAYKNVICLGHLMDAVGKKMSKSLGNIVDPWEMIEKYGVDTLRLWMYSVNQPGESKNFDEKTVALLHQQVFGLLYNILAFYDLYRDKNLETNNKPNSKNILDQWILARLDELINESTKKMDDYKLLEPVRAIRDFIGDLSTWYLRRSRGRLKDNDKEAKETLYYVLKTLVKLLAPFAPFTAEDIWMKLKIDSDEESVHLTKWPEIEKVNLKIIERMKIVRDVVTKGLEFRQKAGIKIRQPLQSFSFESTDLDEYSFLIKDELNVKEIINGELMLDTNITPELKQEGDYRELVRALQDMRKNQGLTPSDIINISFETDKSGRELIEKFETEMKKTVLISKIAFENNDGEEVKIDSLVFKVKIDKI